MIGAIITATWAGDITLLAVVVGMFATILKMLVDQKTLQKSASDVRVKEIKAVISEVINASPEKIVVNPQPLIVEMKRDMISRHDFNTEMSEIRRRVSVLEAHREVDRRELMEKIENIPSRVIAILKDTKGLI